MKRLSKNSMVISSSELKHGWSFLTQVRRNPEAKRVYPDVRKEMTQDALATRTNQWLLRYKKTKDIKNLKCAVRVAKKINVEDK